MKEQITSHTIRWLLVLALLSSTACTQASNGYFGSSEGGQSIGSTISSFQVEDTHAPMIDESNEDHVIEDESEPESNITERTPVLEPIPSPNEKPSPESCEVVENFVIPTITGNPFEAQ